MYVYLNLGLQLNFLNRSNKNIFIIFFISAQCWLGLPLRPSLLLLTICAEHVAFSHINGWVGKLSALPFLEIFQGRKGTSKTSFIKPQVNICSAIGTLLGEKFYFFDFPLNQSIVYGLISTIHCITFPMCKILAK